MLMLVNKRPYISCGNGVEMLKCEFWKKKVHFVNRIIESHVRPIKAKWGKIWLEWSSPLNCWNGARKWPDHNHLNFHFKIAQFSGILFNQLCKTLRILQTKAFSVKLQSYDLYGLILTA